MNFRLVLLFFIFSQVSFSQINQNGFPPLDTNEVIYEFDIKYLGKSVYPDENYQYVIDYLVQILQQNPTWTVTIRGHVCCGPSYKISKKRAKNVYKILYHLGIPKERMSYKGESDNFPLAFPEKTDEDAAKNRRVDFILRKN